MSIILRDYQLTACKNIVKAVQLGNKKVLFSMATGAGKTCVMGDFSIRAAGRGLKSLIVVDRQELLKQTVRFQTNDCKFGFLTADTFKPDNVTVAMLQTLRARLKSEIYQEWISQYDLIWFDEVHSYSNGSAFQRICDFAKDDATIIGVSASVWNDRGYLLNGFDEFINGADIRTLVEQGYLVKPNHMTIELFDFSRVKVTSTGDYDSGSIDDIVVNTDKADKVFDLWSQHSMNKKTIAFCSTVTSAEYYARYFKMNGVKAKCISAKNSDIEREQVLADYKSGDIEVLFNVGLLVAGFDEPSIETVMFLNPTKILRRYIQCAGRGLRLCPEIGKTECLFLDFVGNSFRHLEVDAIRSYIPAPEKTAIEECDEIECPACGFVFDISEKECPECGFQLDFSSEEGGGAGKPKNKRDFEKLIKLKSVQKELHDVIYGFVNLPCLIKIEETGNLVNGKPERKWCYGYREDGTPIFKTSKDYSPTEYPYPMVTTAKKTNCWYVFHQLCIKYDPKVGALRYYGKKLRKARAFLDQIKNPNNRAMVNLYKIMD